MFRKSSIAVAVVATIAAALLAPPSISAVATGGDTSASGRAAELYVPGTKIPKAWTARNRSPEARTETYVVPRDYYWKKYAKCSTSSLSSTCWSERWNPWPSGSYCSSSLGCFNYPLGSTRNWSLQHYACCWTEAQLQCVANIVATGWSILSAPMKLALSTVGVGLSVWGCKKVFY